MTEAAKVDSLEEATEATQDDETPKRGIQDDERLEPPPGVNREIWDRIPQDVHRKAAQAAQVLLRPVRKEGN